MASICVDGPEVPFVLPVDEGGRARVLNLLLHIYFRFVESSIYVEEERKSVSGEVQHSVPVVKSVEEDGHC